MQLQLRSVMKDTSFQPVTVHGIENADKNPKAIHAWINQISKLHLNKPVSTLKPTKAMPDIDSLMQEWPGEVERMLETVRKQSRVASSLILIFFVHSSSFLLLSWMYLFLTM